MRPFMRDISAAVLTGSLDFEEAVTITASAPKPPVRLATIAASESLIATSAPSVFASAARCAIGIEADDDAAVGFQDLDSQQADQSETHDDDGFAERRRGLPHALQRDRPERDEARILVVDASGHGEP